MKYPVLDQSIIKQLDFPESQYYKEVFPKKQICLHHTSSGPGVDGDARWWMHTPERVGTCVIVARDGTIHSCFDSKYWAHHLGLHVATNRELNQHSIGIEIDAWGPLAFLDGQYRSYTGDAVSGTDIVYYEDGFKTLPASPYFDKHGVSGDKAVYYHRYTAAQILSVAQLLELWGGHYNIPLGYNRDMFALNERALAGEPGIWTHVSYLAEKSDCAPQKELIEMLESLTESQTV